MYAIEKRDERLAAGIHSLAMAAWIAHDITRRIGGVVEVLDQFGRVRVRWQRLGPLVIRMD